jgi:hypothetical protein
VARGFRVASYDMLGQGHSDKPRLFIEQHEQVEVLRNLARWECARLSPTAQAHR